MVGNLLLDLVVFQWFQASNKEGMIQEMSAYCHCYSKCLRQFLMNYFDSSLGKSPVLQQDCCSYCADYCFCFNCFANESSVRRTAYGSRYWPFTCKKNHQTTKELFRDKFNSWGQLLKQRLNCNPGLCCVLEKLLQTTDRPQLRCKTQFDNRPKDYQLNVLRASLRQVNPPIYQSAWSQIWCSAYIYSHCTNYGLGSLLPFSLSLSALSLQYQLVQNEFIGIVNIEIASPQTIILLRCERSLTQRN